MERLEDRITEILDKLTADVSVMDAAILVGGFYTGMQGYTPLTAIMKIAAANGAARQPSFSDALLRMPWGIPGLLVESLFLDSEPSVHDNAVQDRNIKLDLMDPRRITTDYLYERLVYLKDTLANAESFIKASQELIDSLNASLLRDLAEQSRLQAEYAAGFPHRAIINQLQTQIGQTNSRIKATEDELWILTHDPNTPPELIKQMTDFLTALKLQLYNLTNQLDNLLREQGSWDILMQQRLSDIARQINEKSEAIEDKKLAIQNYKDQLVGIDDEISKINKILLQKKIALGMVGMIEAYAITRPGMLDSVGNILKGIGEIVPL